MEQREPEASSVDGTLSPHILSPELKQQHEALRIVLQRALWLAERCADAEATEILRARLTNLQAAALLVVVGEVKAGKSSFINALVREDVCEVAPGPCTTAIRELVYGVERDVANLGQSWDRVHLPKDVLREISLVDTPGTNSIIQNHQAITENYVPQSDLIVFVFSAANPHTKSAWELLTLIKKQWHRKMVFVLQQSDRASEKELTTNRAHVEQYARDRHVEDPTVFILSAKREMELMSESGFPEFRTYLRNAIARGEVWRMKVEGSYETIRTVIDRLLAHLHTEEKAIAEERAFYQNLLHKVEAREAKAASLKQLILTKLAATYDRLARHSEDEFAEGLGVANLFRRAIPFLRKEDTGTWLAGLKGRFQESAKRELEIEAARISKELSDEMRTMMEELTESIARRQEGIRECAVLPQTGNGLKMLVELRAKLQRIRLGDALVEDKVEETSDVRRYAVAGGGLAILGAIIAAVSHSLWLDLAGGIFAGLGILLIIAGLIWRRSGMVRDLRQKLDDSRKEFHDRLDAEFSQIFDGLFYEVRQALAESIFRLDLSASHITPALAEAFRVGEAASEMLLGFQRHLAPPPLSRI